MKSKTFLHTLLTLMLVLGSSNTIYAASQDNSTSNGVDNRQLKEKVQWIKQLRDRRTRGPEHKKMYRSALPIVQETASLLNMTKDELLAQLKNGKSLSEVAESQGLSSKDLIDKLMVLRIQKVNEAVIAGKLPAEKAEKIKTKMKEHVTYLVAQKGTDLLEHLDSRKWLRHSTLRHFTPAKMAELIGISEQELVSQLQAGQSLSEIAQDRGISREELAARMKSEAL